MKTLQFAIALILALSLLFGCADPNREVLEKAPGPPKPRISTTQTSCSTVLLGDKDGFGQGFKDGYALYVPGGTSLPLDWRSNDPLFTDVYPADIAPSGNCTHQIQFTMQFTPPSQIGSAKLHLTTLGIQDGDQQVCNSDTDIKLFMDGQEIPGAFDAIDQFDNISGKWSDFVSSFDIAIPQSLLPLLKDGSITLQWKIIQTVPGVQSYDSFAIDYCELTVCSPDSH